MTNVLQFPSRLRRVSADEDLDRALAAVAREAELSGKDIRTFVMESALPSDAQQRGEGRQLALRLLAETRDHMTAGEDDLDVLEHAHEVLGHAWDYVFDQIAQWSPPAKPLDLNDMVSRLIDRRRGSSGPEAAA